MANLSKLEQAVLMLLEEEGKPMKVLHIAKRLNYSGGKNYKKLAKAISFLERVGELTVDSSGRCKLNKTVPQTVIGIYRANDKGYGFISYSETESDLFVPPGKSGIAMSGDEVEVRILKAANAVTGKGSEAEVIRVVERKVAQLVGEFIAFPKEEREATGYLGYVKPQGEYSPNVRVNILSDGIHPADHTICVVKIKDYPTTQDPNTLTGYVAKEVGHIDEPGVDILSVLYQYGIPHQFPENVQAQANAIDQVIHEDELKDRVDLRDELVITIDGADAKDLDDAISLSVLPNGLYKLGVHIADVAHYVTENSAIDHEAYARGTSVYLTDRVVPMLPQRLSNGICSLHPHEDRLTITCDMTLTAQGDVVDHRIYLSVIHSNYRMTYDDVNLILDGDVDLQNKYAEIVPMLEQMATLHHALEEQRRARGALDFDVPESKVEVDKEGHPLAIVLRTRGVAERLIESFMLIANETVARHYTQRELPFIYRVHEQPDEDRMGRFAEMLTAFGMILRGDVATISSSQLQKTLAQAEGESYERVVSTMMLRSMKQAKYNENPLGHYGLAATDYTHFTSPIRRYPDLIVHRLIHLYLSGGLKRQQLEQWKEKLVDIAVQSSKMERRAVDAEREVDAMKKAEFMENKIGEKFQGVISSITSFGMFIELPNTIEGLVTIKDLKDDYYEFNQAHLMLIGSRTGNVYRIGQKVEVELISVDVPNREIDFKLLWAEPVEGLIEIKPKKKKDKKRLSNQHKKIKRKK